eukprot:173063-Alexandrium_andersonii.AAC.1
MQRGLPIAEGFCGALVEMRADLLEFVGALGFKNWQHAERPCWCCHATQEGLHNYPDSFDDPWWGRRDAAAYN